MRLGKQRGQSITLFYKMPPRPPHYCYNALTFFRHGIMSGDITLLTLFLIGFFGGGHCVGMCGGLSSAFALQLPPHIKRFWLIVLLNAGRISSYITIGVLLGLLGQIGISLDQTRWLQNGLFVAANVLLLFLGLYLAGLSTLATKVESLGRPVWRRSRSMTSCSSSVRRRLSTSGWTITTRSPSLPR